MTGSVVNLFMVYQFLKRLVQPFTSWKAFELGIIDEDGKILRKSKTFKTKEERESFKVFDIMVLKLKVLLGKLPFGKTKLASFAAALWLIKESEDTNENALLTEEEAIETSFLIFFNENKNMINNTYLEEARSKYSVRHIGAQNYTVYKGNKRLPLTFDSKEEAEEYIKTELKETVPVNNIGSGNIAIRAMPLGKIKRRKKIDEITRRDRLLTRIMEPIKFKQELKKAGIKKVLDKRKKDKKKNDKY